ncbi:MAG: enoyl-CoA hydratase-related protein [Alphaproteobacteria bacterium]
MKVLRERRGAVEIITINRPEVRNCVDGETAGAMRAAFDEIERDESVRAVILTAAGDKAFCTGLDLKAFAKHGAPVIDQVVFKDVGWAGIAQRHLPQPLIGAINGPAIAGGLELALACDFLVAAEHAIFAIGEARVGGLSDAGACLRLPHWIPLPLAKEMLFTALPIDAARAYSVGLVNHVVPKEQLLDKAIEVAETIARLPQESIVRMKRLVHEVLDVPEKDAWPINNRYLAWSQQSAELAQGAKAFTEGKTERYRR